MVVHYPRTVWKNSYAEHEVTGKIYNLKKKKKYHVVSKSQAKTAFNCNICHGLQLETDCTHLVSEIAHFNVTYDIKDLVIN